MSYYLVDVSSDPMCIAPLVDKKVAVIESENINFLNCRIHLVDYKESGSTRDDWKGAGAPWMIQKMLTSLPEAHKFSIGDRVQIKRNINVQAETSHVYKSLEINRPYTVSNLYYYNWGNKTYSVVGFDEGYGGWIPEDFLEPYVEQRKAEDPLATYNFKGRIPDTSPFKPGDTVWTHNYSGSGIPYPLERIEEVQIVPYEYYNNNDTTGSDNWTHVCKFRNKLLRLDNNRGKFSYLHPNECTPTLPERYPYGSTILAGYDGVGNGLPDQIVSVKICNPRHVNDLVRGLLETSEWDHIVEYERNYYRINTRTASGISSLSTSVNCCVEVPLPEHPDIGRTAMRVDANSMCGSTASTGTITITSEESYEKPQSKLKALKQQKPITLKTKTKNHGNERRVKLRDNRVS